MQYKVLFVGLGSIGQRHLKNLISIADIEADALRTKNEPFENIKKIYTAYDEVPNDYDIAFITNPTNLHYEAVKNLKDKTKHLFIEKPIFDKPMTAEFTKGVNYIACPLRYNSEIKALKDFVKNNKIYSFRAICSSYLPNWRKTGDYRKCYSARKDMGGGVELDLIHEIDYLKWIFGKFDTIKRISSKKSNLEITSNDIALYLLENKSVAGSLHLDYFGREIKREIEVFSENETRTFDLTKNKNDVYIAEMKYFLDLVKDNNKNGYNTPKEALESLEVALS